MKAIDDYRRPGELIALGRRLIDAAGAGPCCARYFCAQKRFKNTAYSFFQPGMSAELAFTVVADLKRSVVSLDQNYGPPQATMVEGIVIKVRH